MAGGAKKLWARTPFASSSRKRIPKPPPPPPPSHPPIPAAFLCPVSSLLMFDPTITDSGDSLDLHCLQACRNLNFIPPNLNLPLPSFPLIPNYNLALAIQEWCDTYGHPVPTLISPESVLHFLRGLQSLPNPPPPPLPRPPFKFYPGDEDKFLNGLQQDINCGLAALKETPLCSARILGAVVPLLTSPEPDIQLSAGDVIRALSEPNNRIHILRSGAILPLITMLNTGEQDAWLSAAATLHKLAMDAPYYCLLTIGALGAIKPLLDRFCDNFLNELQFGRAVAGMTLYQLSLHCQVNAEVLVEEGGVKKLMEIAGDETLLRELRKEALRILKCLMGVERGREELMEGTVFLRRVFERNIGVLLRLSKEGEGLGLQSLNVMYSVCRESLARFREVAVFLRGEVVLAEEMEDWGQNGKKMATGMLRVLRGEINSREQLDDLNV